MWEACVGFPIEGASETLIWPFGATIFAETKAITSDEMSK